MDELRGERKAKPDMRSDVWNPSRRQFSGKGGGDKTQKPRTAHFFRLLQFFGFSGSLGPSQVTVKLSGSEALTSEASEMDTLNSEKTGETGEAAKADPGVKYSVFSM